ncbi:MAG TPA: amidohydrolase family protein [Candidatus Limnocylindria bacterium]|nr:amidohydrolase family protein [Candidatus Limnocylindria bacterium]
MLKIDAFPHILPPKFFARMFEQATGEAANMRKRVSAIPVLYDLDARQRVMERFGDDYRQILTVASPPIETLGPPPVAAELARLANDELAELCAAHPDRFMGFAASLAMNDPDAAVREARRATTDLGALGVQIFTNVNGLALDDPRFAPLFATMAELDRPIWVHPARASAHPDYLTEARSKYELWWVFGWPYETAIFMSRLIFSGILNRHPALRVLTHHGGGMVPHFAGRIGPGLDQLGARTPDEDLTKVGRTLGKRPYDYYKMFYGDTALFGAEHALRCAIDFFGVDHILFGSDMPFDPEKGTQFIRETIANIEALGLTAGQRAAIYEGNARRVLGVR